MFHSSSFLFAKISNLPHGSVVAKKFSIQGTRVQIPGIVLFLNNIRLYRHFLDSFGFIPWFRQKHLNLWVICLYKFAQVFFQYRLWAQNTTVHYKLGITVKSKSIISRKKHHMHCTLTDKKKGKKGRGECAVHIA